MSKLRVLAICIHNSARSQMTEEFLRLCGDDLFDVESAGVEPGSINPIVAELLLEEGIDIREKATQSVFDLHKAGRSFDYVIAVCDKEAAEQCPIYPSERERFHWPFPDPSRAEGTAEEKKEYIRPIMEQIRARASEFCEKVRQGAIA